MCESTVYNIDCMEYMKTLPDKAFDLAIVDPPYRDQNENYPTKDMRKNRFAKEQGLGKKPTVEFFDELRRVSKNQIVWGANNFPEVSPFKGFVVWRKLTIGEDFTMSACEIASLSEGLCTTSKYFEHAPQGTKDDPRIHPTQKPVALYKWLLTKFAKEGDRILDTHLGSGSSRIACYDLGFDFVGCEIDSVYFELQEKRFKDFSDQLKLF